MLHADDDDDDVMHELEAVYGDAERRVRRRGHATICILG